MNAYGIGNLLNVARLPLLESGVQVHYEGSIDKQGANADWDWWLYPDERGEWVIFDVSGPGCIYNFVQHRYLSSEEPVFRFYFDGEEEPRFAIRAGEFGLKHPFIEPLASRYIGPLDHGRGPIRVIRSFVPMPYRSACRITSSVKLMGFDRSKGEGGWGHVIYHSYREAGDVVSFTDDEDYTALLRMLKNAGVDPKSAQGNVRAAQAGIRIGARERIPLLELEGRGVVQSIKVWVADFTPSLLSSLWISIRFDAHEKPDVELPIGAFFGNELGLNAAKYLMSGLSPDGFMYHYFPMPYWKSARVEVENRGTHDAQLLAAEVQYRETDEYGKAACGYFRASPYYARRHTEGADSIIAEIAGRGKVVSTLVTCYAQREGIVSCEGDVRVHIDGIRTPQVESDGSESHSCYGWGFPTPPETNPFSGYDGKPDSPWSMMRALVGDWYPFHERMRFGIESGGNNDQYLEHSGAVLYYGRDEADLVQTDFLDLGDAESIRSHHYEVHGDARRVTLKAFFEGDDDHIEVDGEGFAFSGYSAFDVAVDPANEGVRLRRMSDQRRMLQAARVWVDGVEVEERLWYFADRNPHKRWLEDEFEIPPRYTRGKERLSIRIEPVAAAKEEKPIWNEYRYRVYSYMNPDG